MTAMMTDINTFYSKIFIGAIDINQGCSGFVYALGIAKALVESIKAIINIFIKFII